MFLLVKDPPPPYTHFSLASNVNVQKNANIITQFAFCVLTLIVTIFTSHVQFHSDSRVHIVDPHNPWLSNALFVRCSTHDLELCVIGNKPIITR